MILTDKQIRELGIIAENFSEDCLTPNGYDLRVDFSKDIIFVRRKHKQILTMEYLKLPPNIIGRICIRSSFAALGLIGSFGVVDAGFEGKLRLNFFSVWDDVLVAPGERTAQIVFEETKGNVEKTYAQRSGNYQGQREILAPIKS